MKTPPPVPSVSSPAFLERPRVETQRPTSVVSSLLASCLGLGHLPQSPRKVVSSAGPCGIAPQSNQGQHPVVAACQSSSDDVFDRIFMLLYSKSINTPSGKDAQNALLHVVNSHRLLLRSELEEKLPMFGTVELFENNQRCLKIKGIIVLNELKTIGDNLVSTCIMRMFVSPAQWRQMRRYLKLRPVSSANFHRFFALPPLLEVADEG